jgi:hypothetical protein
MAQNKMKLIIIFSAILLASCAERQSYYLRETNSILSGQYETFSDETTIKGLLDHFPRKIKNDSVGLWAFPPSPHAFICEKQHGDILIRVQKSDYAIELNELLSKKIDYHTVYSDSSIIINLSELRRSIFPVEKCNKWYDNKPPIPYFESYDFRLGVEEEKKIIEGEEIPYFNYLYTIPNDLQVYVIEAKAGDFWKVSCNEARPESLKEWKHGYSRGIATSDSLDILVFWAMVW